MSSTCQICGREIQANTGLIAHHGYTRPYPNAGFQTASCPGARFMPYEMACDAIQPYIDKLEATLTSTQQILDLLLSDPPKYLQHIPQARRGKPLLPPEDVERPANFNKDGIVVDRYSQLYSIARQERERTIKHLTEDIKYLKFRLETWKAPADAFTLTSMPAPRKENKNEAINENS